MKSTRCLVTHVASFTGFGVSAPSTVAGKIMLVFYGLLGCSAAILFFNLFLERVITLLTCILLQCRRKGTARRPADGTKPSVYQVLLILLVVVMLVACAAASLYSIMEGWTYLESLYFCFVAFSTVGFGDLVSGQRAQHGETRAYQVANCLLMLLGVCCTYSLFNSIAVIIKQGLSWLLVVLERLYDLVGDRSLQLRPLWKLCYYDDSDPDMQQIIAVYTSKHSRMWPSCTPSAIGECLCGKANIQTISKRDMWHADTKPLTAPYKPQQNTPGIIYSI